MLSEQVIFREVEGVEEQLDDIFESDEEFIEKFKVLIQEHFIKLDKFKVPHIKSEIISAYIEYLLKIKNLLLHGGSMLTNGLIIHNSKIDIERLHTIFSNIKRPIFVIKLSDINNKMKTLSVSTNETDLKDAEFLQNCLEIILSYENTTLQTTKILFLPTKTFQLLEFQSNGVFAASSLNFEARNKKNDQMIVLLRNIEKNFSRIFIGINNYLSLHRPHPLLSIRNQLHILLKDSLVKKYQHLEEQ